MEKKLKQLTFAVLVLAVFLVVGFLLTGGKSDNNVGGRMGSRVLYESPLLTMASTVGATGTPQYIGDYSNCDITVANTGTSLGDIFSWKLIASSRDVVPNLEAGTTTPLDGWDFVKTTNLQTGTSTAGDPGYANVVRGVERYSVSDTAMQWLAVVISSSSNALITDATSTISIIANCKSN